MASLPFSPDFLSRYEILRPLGEGGVASVFLARQLELDRACAIKAMSPGVFQLEELRERFLDEGRVLARIHHPHIVGVYDAGQDGEQLFLVLEYVEGSDLRRLIDSRVARRAAKGRRGALSIQGALELAASIADGLECAHQQGIVHRDLKPENVLLTSQNVPKVADFGFAKFGSEGMERAYATKEGVILGTPFYVAPEIVRGKQITPQADLYALGIMLWEMLVGRPPFQAPDDTAVLLRHLNDPLPSVCDQLPRVPREVNDLVQWCGRKEPEKRPSSAASLARVLREAQEKVETWSREIRMPRKTSREGSPKPPAKPAPPPSPGAGGGSPWPLRVGLGGAALVLCLALGAALRGFLGPTITPPDRFRVEPTFEGFSVRWSSEHPYSAQLSYRNRDSETWQVLLEPQEVREHRLTAENLESGEYELQVAFPGGETPCPPFTVRDFKTSQPRVRSAPEGTDLFLEFETSIPVEAAVTPESLPGEDSWSPPSQEHRLLVPIPPGSSWPVPSLFLRDPSGTHRLGPRLPRIQGWRRLGEDLGQKLVGLEVHLDELARSVVKRAEALLESEAGAIRQLRVQLERDHPEASPNKVDTMASRQHLASIGEPFQAIFEQEEDLRTISERAPHLAHFLASEEIPRDRRLDLYHGLLSFLPLDAATEAFGAPGPLHLTHTLGALVKSERHSNPGVAGRLAGLRARVEAGRGRELLRLETFPEQIMVIPHPEEKLPLGGIGGASMAQELANEFYQIDMGKAPEVRSFPFEIPRGLPEVLSFHLRGYNIQEWMLVHLDLQHEDGGAPFRLILRNLPDTFPGLVSNPAVEILHDQILTVHLPSWCLPPGRYTGSVGGVRLPDSFRMLTWSLQDLLLTW